MGSIPKRDVYLTPFPFYSKTNMKVQAETRQEVHTVIMSKEPLSSAPDIDLI